MSSSSNPPTSSSPSPSPPSPSPSVPTQSASHEFSEKSYWDSRFKEESQYEWLCEYDELKPIIIPLLDSLCLSLYPPSSPPSPPSPPSVSPLDRSSLRILIVGNGNSPLPKDLSSDGFINITVTDYSAVVIDALQKEWGAKYSQMTFKVVDMLGMKDTLSEESFDVVIDKGALDAIQVDAGDPWNPHLSVVENSLKFLKGVNDVVGAPQRTGLKGAFFSISFHQKHFRINNYLSKMSNWKCIPRDIEKGKALPVFLYECLIMPSSLLKDSEEKENSTNPLDSPRIRQLKELAMEEGTQENHLGMMDL